jgi:uncharacterized protein DUF5985
MFQFLSGMTAAGFLIAALFFFRFWRRTRDSLFATFGVSFILFAIGQTTALVSGAPQEDRTWVYLLRLAGFTLLLVAIIRKNLGESKAVR